MLKHHWEFFCTCHLTHWHRRCQGITHCVRRKKKRRKCSLNTVFWKPHAGILRVCFSLAHSIHLVEEVGGFEHFLQIKITSLRDVWECKTWELLLKPLQQLQNNIHNRLNFLISSYHRIIPGWLKPFSGVCKYIPFVDIKWICKRPDKIQTLTFSRMGCS